MLNIVLHEPEIPANTGNIGRTCVATNTRLHLIEPLGFRLDEKNLKRAGMDYWGSLDVTTYIDYADFLERNPGAKIYMATTSIRGNGCCFFFICHKIPLFLIVFVSFIIIILSGISAGRNGRTGKNM